MQAPLIQICGARVDVTDDEREIDRAAHVFHEGWFLRLPAFLDAATLARAQEDIASRPMKVEEHPGVGVELNHREGKTVARFDFLLSDRRVRELVARLSRAPRVGSFFGRIYRMQSGGQHYDGWHDDDKDSRVCALTVNVGEPHRGGCLTMRRKGFEETVSIPNTTPGDAVLFRIASQLEHRVTDVEGDAPKTAYAGWFLSEPDIEERLRLLHARRT
jgi:hypothetical protein